DLLGILGFAREVAAVTGEELRQPDLSHSQSDRQVGDFVSVTNEAPDLCLRFTASIIEDVQVGPSPPWMQQRLVRAGMRPINNVVDVTNYVMLETGQPLHAFDYERVRGSEIGPRRAHEGEILTTLDEVERDLDSEMLMICDGEGPVAVAGIMGAENSEVSESTSTVLLEVANFQPGSIRRTSTRLRLRSEASLRFEKGIGPELAPFAQARAMCLLEGLAGGRPATGLVDSFPSPLPSSPIALPAARIEQVLGISIEPAEVIRILLALGFEVSETGGVFQVTPPFWRTDVALPDDLVEELIRIYGYEKLPTTVLRGALPEVPPRPLERVRERVRSSAAGLGFQEVVSYTLTSSEILGRVVAADDQERGQPLAATNPVASQHTYLRTSLRGSLLTAYSANRRHEDVAMRLFEVGFEYIPAQSTLPQERPVLCAVLGGQRLERWKRAGTESLDFFDAKGAIETLLEDLGVEGIFTAEEQFGLLAGHTAAISVGDESVGVVAQVYPDVAATFDIEEPVFLFELWLEPLTRVIPDRPDYGPPSRYPEARRDLALLVPADMPAAPLLDVIRTHRVRGVRITVDVFDEYRGEGVPPGQKSLALAVRFRAEDRTLGEKEVSRIEQGLLRRLEKDLGATLRA
ncbi:MAG TPA: phenylalanine--tRNA ligase subunit beta, partial [Dehalococcoidia bacterium]|nr:phenylalanine--tRNA ligase subunit beta [Dehalococcoidia bacterium]